jgi:hypothetical protein
MDDTTLKLETDQGQQTRLFRFGGRPTAGGEATVQGYSSANWERPPAGAGTIDFAPIFAARYGMRGRSLEVVTTNLRPGYLRKNGVPYSANTTVTEYFDAHKTPGGDEWFTVTTIVRDPQYLSAPWIISSDFKKEPDGSKFDPTPCSAR